MRERIKDNERLNHIIESIDYIFEFTQGYSYEDFVSNKMLKFAVIKNLEIIGLRHILVHDYYQISDSIIWNTITEDLQDFKCKIQKILDSNK